MRPPHCERRSTLQRSKLTKQNYGIRNRVYDRRDDRVLCADHRTLPAQRLANLSTIRLRIDMVAAGEARQPVAGRTVRRRQRKSVLRVDGAIARNRAIETTLISSMGNDGLWPLSVTLRHLI
jgi:hypothetical protein